MPLKPKWEIREVSIDKLIPFEENPRIISRHAFTGLKRSIERFGCVEPIVWNEQTGHIVGGHQRYRVLLDAGAQNATVVVVTLSPEEERAANLTLNNPEIEGEWDDPISDLLSRVEQVNPEMFANLNLDDLRKSLDIKVLGGDKSPEGPELSLDTDTTCPCCHHSWKISAEDVTIEKKE